MTIPPSPFTVCPHTRIQQPEDSKPVCLDCGRPLMQLEKTDGSWVWAIDVFEERERRWASLDKDTQQAFCDAIKELHAEFMEKMVATPPLNPPIPAKDFFDIRGS